MDAARNPVSERHPVHNGSTDGKRSSCSKPSVRASTAHYLSLPRREEGTSIVSILGHAIIGRAGPHSSASKWNNGAGNQTIESTASALSVARIQHPKGDCN